MTNSSTRISRSEVVDLCEAIHASGSLPVFGARVLGLFLCVRLTLTYLRHNPCQELLAEVYWSRRPPSPASSPPTRPWSPTPSVTRCQLWRIWIPRPS